MHICNVKGFLNALPAFKVEVCSMLYGLPRSAVAEFNSFEVCRVVGQYCQTNYRTYRYIRCVGRAWQTVSIWDCVVTVRSVIDHNLRVWSFYLLKNMNSFHIFCIKVARSTRTLTNRYRLAVFD